MLLFPLQSNQYPSILLTQLVHFGGQVPLRDFVSFFGVVLTRLPGASCSELAPYQLVEVLVKSNLYCS